MMWATLRRMLALALILLAACDAVADRDLYLQSITASPEEAARLCARIDAEQLQADCVVQRAAALAMEGDRDGAFAMCEQVVEPRWGDECWFLVVDILSWHGPAPVEACERAGRFRVHCLGHAYGRRILEVGAEYGERGQETLLVQALTEASHSLPPDMPEENAGFGDVRYQAARVIAEREATEGPFDIAWCGVADSQVCVRVYEASLGAPPDSAQARALCVDGTPELAAVVSAGLRAWTGPSEHLAAQAWTRICRGKAHLPPRPRAYSAVYARALKPPPPG